MARPTPPPAEVLAILVEQDAGRTICRIRGELDSLNVPRLRAVLAEHMDADLVLDLSALDFIDSSGLGVFVGALRRFEESGHRLTLRAPTTSIQRVFAITGLDHAFVIEH